jgi:hypothetical protein
VGIAASQQPQRKKRGRPPKDPSQLSNNPQSKRQQEYQHWLEGEKKVAACLKGNDRAVRLCARETARKNKN